MAVSPQDEDLLVRRLSRRHLLRGLIGGAGAAALLAACAAPSIHTQQPDAASATMAPPDAAASGATAAPAIGNGGVTLRLMYNENEFSNDEIKAFTDANPTIAVERVAPIDDAQLKAAVKAGDAPDLFRTEGRFIPSLVNQGVVLDLSDYFKNSGAIKISDLAPANSYYKYQGTFYGMAKDWSPDHSMFASNQAFTDAGLKMPDPTRPLRYAEIADLAKGLTKREGDRVVRMGWAYEPGWFVRTIQRILAEEDQKLYTSDFAAITLKDNKLAVDALRFFFDLSRANVTWSPLTPDPVSPADDFTKGLLGVVSYGYWFSGVLATAKGGKDVVVTDQVTMLPAPTWGGKKRVNPSVGAAGSAIAKTTKHPEEAWKLFEYYHAGPPAQARAKSGWGVPALVSLYDLMPTDTPVRQQVQAVLRDEITYADVMLDVNPYYQDSAFNQSWMSNLDQALHNKITFDQLVDNIERDVNTAITSGKAASERQ